ncbi:hypothetical protein GGS23DRAFT_594763 [Durotheca rogersii]|uniref:uncharacterized protein n=1 Tax=Durotheca rogersii TaxID=419775 RepID=UPI00221F4A7D|nr:uncharacterized protein GGS23DRAFT_594763 [Durotheca rogersii]KAI5865218.1 hypothetical protein GGS23DRAFT_594763 [Durotheca rogersii]
MSAHPNHSPIPGDNPNQPQVETAELPGDLPPNPLPHPLQSNPIQGNQYPPPPPGPPPSSSTEPQYYPPPPPGPPPTNQPANDYYPPPPPGPPPSKVDAQYYPPPPPGPPPKQTYDTSPEEPDSPPPSYSEIGPGVIVTDEKLPALPPRPPASQAPQPVPQFPPPPTASLPVPGVSHHHHHQNQSTASAEPSSSTSPSKPGLGRKFYEWGIKAGAPINKLTNMLGSEAFWPTSMDKECDKAARVLRSFCKDGVYTTGSTSARPSRSPSPSAPPSSTSRSNSPGPSGKPKVLVKIPRSVVANAKGLAIFTTFRTGFHISGAGGSGLVVARLPDGSWSPPAGFLVHTLGAGLMVGLDIYDCVCVLNTEAAVDAFARPRVSLGGEIAVAAGPVGAGTGLEASLGRGGAKPVFSYMKSRGLYGGVQVDGTVVVQRADANAVFYGVDRINTEDILRGEVPRNSGGGSGSSEHKDKGKDGLVMWPEGARQLMEVLKAAEGKGADESIIKELGSQPTPGDLAPPPAQPNQPHQLGVGGREAGGATEKVRFG